MWLLFAAACLASVAVLYAPGYFAGRAVRLGSFSALAVAPAFSVVLLAALGIVLQVAGAACPAWVLFLAALVISLVVYGASRFAFAQHGAPGSDATFGLGAIPWKLIGLYVGASLLISCVVLLHAMGSPYAFCRLDDSAAHYTLIRSFLDTGFYSMLSANGYATLGGTGGYYPAVWHGAAAIVASLFGDSVALASNAMTLVVCAVVLPVGLLFMLRQLFSGKEEYVVVASGAIVAVAFCAFPWGFVVRGQLLPNLLSFALIPGAMGLLVAMVQQCRGRGSRAPLALSFVVCVVAVAIAQPNGAFTLGIWAVAFGIGVLLCPMGEASHTRPGTKRIALAAALLAGACLGWVALYCAPPLQSVVSYTWEAFLSPVQAVLAGGMFMFSERTGIQPFLALLVLIGLVRTCKDRRYLWLTAAFLLAFAIWFIGVTTEGAVKHLLAGFWYTDYYRTGAMAALFAIPLAAMGFAWLFEGLKTQLEKRLGGCGATRAVSISVAALLALMLAVQFFPLHTKVGDSDIRAGLMAVHKQVKQRYSWEKYFTGEEDAFVKKCMEAIPEGAVVANFPNDGSCYAYGIEGLNTFFRRSSPDAYVGSEETGRLIRTALSSVSTSQTVWNAVRESGVQYVLLLDCGSGEGRTVSKLRYEDADWEGIETINDETPGFTPVLSEGDMRLYRIDAAFK